MKLSDQVCTLAQAKELEQLGILQDSFLFYTTYNNSTRSYINTSDAAKKFYAHGLKKFGEESTSEIYAAYSTAELGVMLPATYSTLFVNKEDGWYVYKAEQLLDDGYHHITEASARALTLIDLLASGKITAKEVNNRLYIPNEELL